MSDSYLICGAGGFIGGHLVKNLLEEGNKVVAVDNKPFDYWFQHFDECKNYSLDIKEYDNCLESIKKCRLYLQYGVQYGWHGFY